MIDISLVIPLYDEEANVRKLTQQLVELLHSDKVGFEIVLVNNGSHDNTDREIDAMLQLYGANVRKIVVPLNRGFGWGVINGLKACRGRFVGFMAGDFQVDVGETVRVFRIVQKNPASIVKVFRYVRRDVIHRRILSYIYNALFRILYQIDVRDVNGIPKIFPASLLNSLDLRSKGSFFDAELLVKSSYLGYGILEFPVESKKRETGKSKVRLSTILGLFWDLFVFRLGRDFREWKKRQVPTIRVTTAC